MLAPLPRSQVHRTPDKWNTAVTIDAVRTSVGRWRQLDSQDSYNLSGAGKAAIRWRWVGSIRSISGQIPDLDRVRLEPERRQIREIANCDIRPPRPSTESISACPAPASAPASW